MFQGRSTSWREEESGMGGGDPRGYVDRYNNSQDRSGLNRPMRRGWEADDNLPEWAVENPLESGGSFDASGAFHGSDDDDLGNSG